MLPSTPVKATRLSTLLPTLLLACHPGREITPPASTPASATEIMRWVRTPRRDIPLGSRAGDVSLFVIPRTARGAARSPVPDPPCPEPVTEPANIVTLIPAPGSTELFASDDAGSLLRREGRVWTVVPLPVGTPPIESLLGFVKAASPLELVVGVRTGHESELWTLTMAGPTVVGAGPTIMDGPEYASAVEFFRAHDTPVCRVDDRDCLMWLTVEGRTFVDLAPVDSDSEPAPLAELEGSVAVVDISWAEGGDALYVAATGGLCVVDDPGAEFTRR